MNLWHVIQGDARKLPLADASVHCAVTSIPYFQLRDYGVAGQLGLESTLDEYMAEMVRVFREVRRVMRDEATLWLNVGDSYAANWNSQRAEGGGGFKDVPRERIKRPPAGLKPKDLMNVPHRLVLALQADGWWHRDTIIWHKPNPMPSSVTDRTTTAHEYIFLLTKRPRYYFDAEAIKEKAAQPAGDARLTGQIKRAFLQPLTSSRLGTNQGPATSNKRSVWRVSTEACKAAHFATFPKKLITPCILAGTSEKGCCPKCGAPWRRVVEKVRVATRPGTNTKIKVPNGWDTGKGAHGSFHRQGRGETEYREILEVGNRDPQRHVSQTTGTTWVPGCKCGADLIPVPCTVFDPFTGSGTTAIVAARHGRRFVGTELNPDYIAIARKRIVDELARPVKKPRKPRCKITMNLFGPEAA